MSKIVLNLVVAMCNNRGIGKDGHLPWKMIRKDMDFFKKITSETKDPDKRNVVIMGRKTWFSIPEKNRPLPKRINIILSRGLGEAPEGVYIARSLDEALSLVTKDLTDTVESIYIIGGSSIYKEAIESDHNVRIFLTKVFADYDCDTYLPEFDENQYKLIENYEGVPVGKQTDKDIDLLFEVYEKDKVYEMFGFNIMVAMCDNRGIALDYKLPWPELPSDYKYYTETCAPKSKGKYCSIIKGRKSWDATLPKERTFPGYLNMILSRSERERYESDQSVHKVFQSFEKALEYSKSLTEKGICEKVWVLGGQDVFETAIFHHCCKNIYLTRVYGDFESNRFFPEIPEYFKEISVEGVNHEIQEENGVKFQFKVYSNTLTKACFV